MLISTASWPVLMSDFFYLKAPAESLLGSSMVSWLMVLLTSGEMTRMHVLHAAMARQAGRGSEPLF
jgi:hypothetical protein